jgi:ABC-type multidrug transport system fused ATPase/permease subunit
MLVIAHRLSTIRQADNIIVLNHGKMVEQGTHEELIEAKSYYYDLVKNQMQATEQVREDESDHVE